MRRGKLIVLEGVSGTGKSTIARAIKSYLESEGIKAIYNHGALTYTDIGRQFKKQIKNYPHFMSSAYYIADLVQVTVKYIKPWLQQGYYVIQDRYSDSITSFVRGIGRLTGSDVDVQPVIRLYQDLGLIEKPDILIFCRAPFEVIQERLSRDDTSHDKYLAHPELIQYVQQEFSNLIRQYKDPIILDTDRVTNVHATVRILRQGAIVK